MAEHQTFAELTTIAVGGPVGTVVSAARSFLLVEATLEAWATGDDWLIVGGGSNLLVSDEGFGGTVIAVATRGIERLRGERDDVIRLRVQAGRATWGVDVDASYYVQEAALERRAVSFTKGCYLGQEIVCMLQMRGKVHRKLARVTLDREVAAGTEVRLEGNVVGKITSVDAATDGVHALALLKTSAIAEGKAIDAGGTAGVVVGEAG